VLAYLKSSRAGHPLPPGRLTDLYNAELRDRRYILNRASEGRSIFKALQFDRIIICLVGLPACTRLLSEQASRLRANSVDTTSLFPKGILRNLEGDDHRHYRRALVTALNANAHIDASQTNARIIDHWLYKHAERYPQQASSSEELTKTLDKIATGMLMELYFGVKFGTADFDELMSLFHNLGPDGFVWNIESQQKQAFDDIRNFLLQRLPEPTSAQAQESASGVMYSSFSAQHLDDVMLGNLIYMVEMGRYDLHSLLRWLLKHAADNSDLMRRLASNDAEEAEGEQGLAQAFVQETLRMDQSERLRRVVIEDFVFDGYFFPKNAIVRLCLWESHKLPENFHEPFAFNPQRFLDQQFAVDAYAPFGLQHHRCPMADPVVQMAACFVKTLADGYQVEPVRNTAANRGKYHWQPGADFSVLISPRREPH
jgi:cytochrome P450